MLISSSRFIRIAVAVFLVVCLNCATTPTGAAQEVKKNDDDAAKKEYKARVREQTVSLIDSLFFEIDELKDKHGLGVRVELAEQLIKLLAQKRSLRCRQLLDSLFAESLELISKSPKTDSSINEQRITAQAINKILRIAAGMSGKLARDYLNRYVEAEREMAEKKARPLSGYYLRLGAEAVEASPNLAFDIGQEFLKQEPKIGTDVLRFMYQLSEKDVSLADKFLIEALRNIKSQKGRDVNELLLIHSYVRGLNIIPAVSAKGMTPLYVPYKPLPESSRVAPSTISFFLMTASEILLDDSRYSSNQPLWGAEGDMLAIKIIEPQISQSLPLVAVRLRERQNVLASYLADERAAFVEAEIDKWNRAAQKDRMRQDEESSPQDRETLLQKAEKSVRPDEKDMLYYEAANLAVEKREYSEAVEICEKISESSRAPVRDFIVFTIAQIELKQGRLDAAKEWARQSSDLTQQACLLTLIARSSINEKKKEFVKASDILGEVESLVSGIRDAREKVYVLAGMGTVSAPIARNKSYEYLQEAIAQANKAESFPTDASITRVVKVGDRFFLYSFYDQELSLSQLIFQHTQKDFFETSFLVDTLKSPLARFRARLALCKAGTMEN
jgi:ribosomal protein L22